MPRPIQLSMPCQFYRCWVIQAAAANGYSMCTAGGGCRAVGLMGSLLLRAEVAHVQVSPAAVAACAGRQCPHPALASQWPHTTQRTGVPYTHTHTCIRVGRPACLSAHTMLRASLAPVMPTPCLTLPLAR